MTAEEAIFGRLCGLSLSSWIKSSRFPDWNPKGGAALSAAIVAPVGADKWIL